MSFVLDSSVALTWCFEDERTHPTRALLFRLTDDGATAPALWPLEVLNVLAMAERRGRIDADRRQELVAFLKELPITLDVETASRSWLVTSELAARWRLTVCDATYLELAQRMSLPLATLDRELRSAAQNAGVEVLGE